MSIFMRFPGGLPKALTLSYDDGVETDIRLIDIMKKHGLLGTFNINSGLFAQEGHVYPAGTIHRRMSKSQALAAYKDSGMEIAVHGYTHPFLEQLPAAVCACEIIRDREALEEMFGQVVRGMAYPFGTTSDEVVNVLKACGIAYSRTVKETESFGIPTNWLSLPSTCHHNNPRLMTLAKSFCEGTANRAPWLFYLWGHSYEFEAKDNWNVIEEFAAYTERRPDVFYATNIQIYEYVTAYKSLVFSANGMYARNLSSMPLWFEQNGKSYMINPGEEKSLT